MSRRQLPHSFEMIDRLSAEVMRRKTGAERLAIVDGLNELSWNLIEANVRQRSPALNDVEVKVPVARRIAGVANAEGQRRRD